jgi:VWFA-related protein
MNKLLALLVLAHCFFAIGAFGQRGGGGMPIASSRGVKSTPNQSPADDQAVPGGNGLPNGVNYGHAEDEGKIEFRSETILVEVPVVVTDKAGTHIKNLIKGDFQILENGQERQIASVEEVTASNAPLIVPTKLTGVFSNFLVNGEKPHNVTIVVLDTVNTPYFDQIYGRQQLINYLADNVGAGQTVGLALITTRGLKVVQEVTGDPDQLVRTLKKLDGEMSALETASLDTKSEAATGDIPTATILGSVASSTPLSKQLEDFLEHGDSVSAEFQQANAIETTMRAFLGIALSLSGVPGRKSLIWATGSFPFSIDSPSTVPGGLLSTLYERAIQALNNAEIAVYPVDIRGLVNYSPFSDITRDSSLNVQQQMRRSVAQLANRAWVQTASIDTLNSFAKMTGGRAFYNSNDLAAGFKRAVDDSSNYYLLSYYLDIKNRKPGWRKLNVSVRRQDAQACSRSGFLVTNTTMNPGVTRKTDIDYALLSPVESTGVPLTVRWLGASGDGTRKKIDYSLHIAPSGITLAGRDRDRFDIEFIAVAFTTKDNRVVANIEKSMSGPVPPGQLTVFRSNGMGFNNAMDLPVGDYNVRFIIRDNSTGRLGSVNAPLTVN